MALPLGRPTLYKPEYCQMLIDHMANGDSLTDFAALIDVHIDTIYEWAKVYSDFSEAKKRAFAKCQSWWEKQGKEGLWEETEYDEKGRPLKSKRINATVWIYNMKCRFKADWHDPEPAKESTDSKATIEAEIAKQLAQSKDAQ